MELVTHKVSHRVAEIKPCLAKALHPSNLGARRDWGFASDFPPCDMVYSPTRSTR
jgi:GDP-D-mannose dehydratase